MTTTHAFEVSGLGKAPFRYLAHPGKAAVEKAGIFWCEHCGTMIKNRHFIVSHDGIVSVVGIDCLGKTGDAGLIDGQKEAARRIKAEERSQQDAARRAKGQQAFIDAYGVDADTLREQNDTEIRRLTDAFLDAFEASSAYAALLKAGNFGNAMIEQARRLETFSPGMRRTIKEVAAKHVSGARKNSKAYQAAYPEIEAEVDALATHLDETSRRVADLKNDVMYKSRAL